MNEAQFGQNAPLVVCVDGSEPAARAVRYATAVARQRGCVLRLVHVLHAAIPLAPRMPLFGADELRSIGLQVIQDASLEVRELSDNEVVTEEVLSHGQLVPAILSHAQCASGIVMASRSGGAQHLLTGSTTAGVLAGSHVPVTCVPPEWNADVRRGGVVVGIANPASKALVEPALARAHEQGEGLTLLHAWRPEGLYDAAIGGHALVDIWKRESEKTMREMVAGRRDRYPDVEVDIDLRYDRPAVALVSASHDADLLVLGRRGHRGPPGLAVGSVARVMMHAAACPVEILPVRIGHAPASTRISAQAGGRNPAMRPEVHQTVN